MTKKEWEELTLDEALDWAYCDYGVYELITEDLLISFAKEKIDEDNIGLALHILGAIYNSEEAYNGYYLYDYSAGTLATPTPITCKEDLEVYISFEADEEDKGKSPFDYRLNAGPSKDNLASFGAFSTKEEAILLAKSALDFWSFTEVVYMPEDDLNTNEVVWRSWEAEDTCDDPDVDEELLDYYHKDGEPR